LGPPDVRLGARRLAFPTRKTLALLIYLAVERGEQPREHLAALLWPESSPSRSHASLRNTLGHLQAALRPTGRKARTAYLSVTHQALALNSDAGVEIDLHTVERAYQAARAARAGRSSPEAAEGLAGLPDLQAAAASQRGDFLAGFSLGDAPGFDDWADLQREVWRRRLGLILDRLSEIQFARGEFAATAETAARWIGLDALNETAYRRKMRAHFAAGERGQALETYEACRAALAAELGVEPEPDTAALAARIRAPHAPHALARPAAAGPSQAPPAEALNTPVTFLENQFAGRHAERRALMACYALAAAGQPQVVVVRGEAGIGKTRLAHEFLARAAAQGAEVLEGRTFESSRGLPYQPLLEAIRPRLERDDALPGPPDAAWWAPLRQLFPQLRAREPERPPGRAQAAASAGQTRLVEALVHLTLALADPAPLVLFVDDLQWADSATLELLQVAMRRWRERAARITLVVSLRSEALRPMAQPALAGPVSLSEWLVQVERELEPLQLELGPLGEGDTLEMVLAILSPPAADFAHWLFHETRGQPFYLMETLKDLLERGALHPRRRAAGEWAFEVDSEHDLGQAVRVPSTVRAVIRSRLDRLSPNAFTLLAAASVLDRQATFERLCALANLAPDPALPALDELVSGRLVLEEAPPGAGLGAGLGASLGAAGAYAFANDMVRDVAYTEAGDARRRLFHRRALKVLAADRDAAALLAHHALAAGLPEAAFEHSLAAGQAALRLAAASEATAHFETARRLAREAGLAGPAFESQLRDLYGGLGRAYELGGEHEQARAVYAELEGLTSARS
jgi:DNA-binding SARP family transcriptional activator